MNGITSARGSIGLMIAFTLIGCATIEKGETLDKEQMLAAAGFRLKLADTPEKLAALMGFPQNQLSTGFKDGKMFYLRLSGPAEKPKSIRQHHRFSKRPRNAGSA